MSEERTVRWHARTNADQVRAMARHSPTAAVYLALMLYAGPEQDPVVWPSRAELAEATGLSEIAVKGALTRLRRAGDIGSAGKPGHYILWSSPGLPTVRSDSPRSEGTAHGPSQGTAHGPSSDSPRSSPGPPTVQARTAQSPAPNTIPDQPSTNPHQRAGRACGLDAVELPEKTPTTSGAPSARPARDPATPSNATPRVIGGVDAETASAVDRLLDWPGWLAGINRDPPRKKARSLELVRAYVAAGHDPATVELWIRAARHPNAGLQSPHAWAHAHLAGYGLDGWQPKTLSGGEQKLHSAILAGDWDQAEQQLNRKHFRLAEAAAVAEADHAARDLASLATDPAVLARVAGVVQAFAGGEPARTADRDVALTEADRRLAAIAASANAADVPAQQASETPLRGVRSGVLAEVPPAAAAAARPSSSADVATPDTVVPASGRQNAAGAKAREPTAERLQPAEEAA